MPPTCWLILPTRTSQKSSGRNHINHKLAGFHSHLDASVCSNSAKDLGAGDRLHVEVVLNFIYLLFRILVHALLEL